MKNGMIAGAFVLLASALAVVGWMREPAEAQQVTVYEYAYLIAVPRIESYDVNVARWASNATDKEYLDRHVFPYEEGQSHFDRQVNSLRKMNELAALGWEVHDAEVGLLRRRK